MQLSILLLSVLGAPQDNTPTPWFTEIGEAAGIEFSHISGARGEYWFPEIMGGGVALLDYDGDGLLDIYCVQSGFLKDADGEGPDNPPNQLFRNLGVDEGTGQPRFEDVTELAGVGDASYGMGVACGDYDRDGDMDLFVTNVGVNILFRNEGPDKQGIVRFKDITKTSGTEDVRWATSAAFLDIDGDRDLDLYVVNNLLWHASTETPCFNYFSERDYCSPNNYNAASPDVLFVMGRSRFQDWTPTSGLDAAFGNGLGVAPADYDQDGNMDLYVANDATPNNLWHNKGRGKYTDKGLLLGCAVNGNGTPEAGMGVQWVDVDQDGDLDLFMTHLRRETNTFYMNRRGRFTDKTNATGMNATSLKYTGFGMGFHDYDLDGQLDLYVVNGAVQAWRHEEVFAADPYAEPNHLYQGQGGTRFAPVPGGGETNQSVGTSRGAAFGDLDNDGDVDVVYMDRDGRTKLLMNNAKGHWIGFRMLDKRGDEVPGAMVGVTHQGKTAWRLADPAYSYLASNDPRAHFGLGTSSEIEGITVRWPSGIVEKFDALATGAYHILREGRGLDDK
ncbi:MAG: CRTAC1 family protein [Planctomycetota bacterium]|nr:CRTAC1 family protein [Planctomycetota bacterium]